MRQRKGLVAGLVALVLLVLAAGTLQLLRVREREADRREATDVAARWLAAWSGARYDEVDDLTAGADAPGDALRRTSERLQVAALDLVPGPLSEDGRTVPYTATAELRALGAYGWASRLRLVETGEGWRVAFDAAALHPELRNGQRLDRRSRPSPRAPLVDLQGRPLRAASADLAANVLGRVEDKDGTTVGVSGLERVLDARLAGQAAGAVVLSDASTGGEVRVLQEYAGQAPSPVPTTLDLDVQRAAEAAISGLSSPAGLVAVDVASGQVRAVANRPVAGQARALTSYAPGSTFKVVTAAALLQAGLRPDSPVDCPDGYRGTGNAESVRPGPTTLRGAFAQSCNATFLQQAEQLPEGALSAAAEAFGFGVEPLLPIAAEGGTAPTGGGSADFTAAIGQGRVEASPLLMASVLAAVASGTWQQPSLVPDAPDLVRRPLPAGVAEALRPMLRAVVTEGSGGAAQVPGPPVHGKTGSAEVGGSEQVHAWFAGYREGLAFAVFVEQGDSGSGTAAPVAARFLRGL